MKQYSEFEMACIKQACEKLFNADYFSISDFDKIGEMLGVNVHRHPNYTFLHSLHCVHYRTMEPVIRDNLQMKVMECLRPDLKLNGSMLFNAVMAEGCDYTVIEDPRFAPNTKPKKGGILPFFRKEK